MNDATVTVSLDEMMDALAARQRRRLLVPLLDRQPDDGPPIVVGGSDSNSDADSLAMRHTHLPKLASYGFIEWDSDTGDVSRGPEFDEIEPLLELLADNEDELPVDVV